VLALAAALAVAGGGCASMHAGEHAHHHFQDDRGDTVQVVNTNVGGKNLFIPSTIVVVAGVTKTLSIFNTHDTPHGFKVPGLGIETVLDAGKETTVQLPASLEGGRVWAVNCHLHPPHRHATIVVLPGPE
jgi:hypothetical protein